MVGAGLGAKTLGANTFEAKILDAKIFDAKTLEEPHQYWRFNHLLCVMRLNFLDKREA